MGGPTRNLRSRQHSSLDNGSAQAIPRQQRVVHERIYLNPSIYRH